MLIHNSHIGSVEFTQVSHNNDIFWEDSENKYLLKKIKSDKEYLPYQHLNDKHIDWCPELLFFNSEYLIIQHPGKPINHSNIPINYNEMITIILDEMKQLGFQHNQLCLPNKCSLYLREGTQSTNPQIFVMDYDFCSIENCFLVNEPMIKIDDAQIKVFLDNTWKFKKNKEKLYYFIINHNRLGVLKQEIDSLRRQKDDIEMLIIVDHNSTYQPLLDFYTSIKDDPWIKIERKQDQYYKINNVSGVSLARVGFGHMLDIIRKYHEKYQFEYFAKSDPDCEIPDVKNYFSHLINISKHYKDKFQIGGALRIDDIPDEYPMKEANIKNERRFWTPDLINNARINGYVYECYEFTTIDGTMSVFPSHFLKILTPFFCHSYIFPAIRVAKEFQIRHLDWYICEPTEELLNYRKTSGLQASHSINWLLGMDSLFPTDEEILDKIDL
jgi:hypothetical protein